MAYTSFKVFLFSLCSVTLTLSASRVYFHLPHHTDVEDINYNTDVEDIDYKQELETLLSYYDQPLEAMEEVLKTTHPNRTQFLHHEIAKERLSEHSPKEAIETILAAELAYDNGLIQSVYALWITQDSQAASDYASQLPDHSSVLPKLIGILAKTKPDLALTLALDPRHSETRNECLSSISRIAPNSLIDYSLLHPELDFLKNHVAYALASITKQELINRGDLLSLLESHGYPRHYIHAFNSLNEEECVQLLSKLSDEDDAPFLSQVIIQLAKHAPQKAYDYASKLPSSPAKAELMKLVLREVSDSAPLLYLKLLPKDQPSKHPYNIKRSFSRICSNHPEQIASCIDKLTTKELVPYAIEGVMEHYLSVPDYKKAKAFADSFEEKDLHHHALGVLFNSPDSPYLSLAEEIFLESQSDRIGSYSLNQFIRAYAQSSLPKATSFYHSLSRRSRKDACFRPLVTALLKQSPQEALHFIIQNKHDPSARNSALKELATHLADTQPELGQQLADSINDESLRHTYNASLSLRLIEINPDSLQERLSSIQNPDLKGLILKNVASTHPALVAQEFKSLNTTSIGKYSLDYFIKTYASQSLSQAEEFCQSCSTSEIYPVAINAYISTISSTLPQKALQLAAQANLEYFQFKQLIHPIGRQLGTDSPEYALAHYKELVPESLRSYFLLEVLKGWSREVPEEAIKHLSLIEDSLEKGRLTQLIIKRLALDSPEEILEYLQSLPPSYTKGDLIHKISSESPEIALKVFLDNSSIRIGNAHLYDIVKRFVDRSPQEALQILSQVENKHLHQQITEYLVTSFSVTDSPELVIPLLIDAHYKHSLNTAVEAIAGKLATEKEFASFNTALTIKDDKLRNAFIIRYMRELSKHDLPKAKELITQYSSQIPFNECYQRIIYEEAYVSPSSTAQWVSSLSDHTLQEACIRPLTTAWLEHSIDAPMNWLQSLPRSKERGEALESVFERWARASPQTLLKALPSISDRSSQGYALSYLSSPYPEEVARIFISQNRTKIGEYKLSSCFTKLLRQSADKALALFDEIESHRLKNVVLDSILREHETIPPLRVFQFAVTHADITNVSRSNQLGPLGIKIGRTEPIKGLELINNVSDSKVLTTIFTSIMRGWLETNREEAFAYIQSHKNLPNDRHIYQLIGGFAGESPSEYEPLVTGITNPKYRQAAFISYIRTLLEEDTAYAQKFMISLPPESQLATIPSFITLWARENVTDTENWIKSLPDGELKTAARLEFASHVGSYISPEAAINLLLELPASEERFKRISHCCLLWYLRTSDKALHWLDTTTQLSPKQIDIIKQNAKIY